jgi:hypothetical protein
MAKTFVLSFHGTKFIVPKVSLFNFFDHHPDLMTATSYDVKSTVRREIFQVFVKALETGSKVPVAKETAASISLLAKEFWLEELLSECSALMSCSAPELIMALSERIARFENQMSSYRSTITKLSERVTKLENQTPAHHSAVIPEADESIARLEQQQELLFSVVHGIVHSRDVKNVEGLHSTTKPAPVPPISASPTSRPIPPGRISTTTSVLPDPPSKSLTEVEFPLVEDKSVDGIVSYLTRKHRGNVHDKGIVTITSKSVHDDDPRHALRNIADFTSGKAFCSKNEPGQWVCWAFHLERVRITHYTMQCGIRSPKSWVIECSLDGEAWTEIDRKTNNADLKASFAVANSVECRFIRLTQTGKRHWGDDILNIYAFEFFGTLLECRE